MKIVFVRDLDSPDARLEGARRIMRELAAIAMRKAA